MTSSLRLPALEILQGPNRTLYSFAVDGKLLSSIAAVSRVRRVDIGRIEGYQRSEVLSHISEIRNYLESTDPMIPNALVIAFDRRVQFQPLEGAVEAGLYSRPGFLSIPYCATSTDEQKPGWVVDGQQRLAAIRAARIQHFPICVTAFIAADEQEQREQFMLVNSTKPLPKGLIYELLPNTTARLPAMLLRRRFPSYLVNRLNYDDGSPLKGLISNVTNPRGLIKDNSMLKLLENSLSEGALYRFRDPDTGEGDPAPMLQLLKSFWEAVQRVFRAAWGKRPKESRLLHGAGVVSLGLVMDAIADRHRDCGIPSVEQFSADLRAIADICRWTDGYWEFSEQDKRKWNGIQNTPKDIQMLSNHLLFHYMEKVWNRRERRISEA